MAATFALALVVGFGRWSLALALVVQPEPQQYQPALVPNLRGIVDTVTALHTTNATAQTNATAHHTMSKMPCQCEVTNPAWKPCPRTQAKCVFIDLGAADGNSFKFFQNGDFGPIANCANGQWEAILVEANPRFDAPLKQLETQFPAGVFAKTSSAAYMCDAHTSFFLDTVTTEHNYWGSSMSANTPDVQKSGKQKVTVPTLNLNRILVENTIPSDWVIVKMDIEGSEWDVIPCIAKAPAASLMDALFMEVHSADWGMAGTTQPMMDAAKAELINRGVHIPYYNSAWTM